MKLLVFPRDTNPYQELLYSELRTLGVRVRYLGQWTPSHTLNLLLLPVESVLARMLGWRVIHLHWIAPMSLPGQNRFRAMRRAARVLLAVWLWACRRTRIYIVWTAHNVLPHEPVFDDDVAARRILVSASDLVIAHSAAALSQLAAIGAVPRRGAVIPHGPFAPARPVGSLRTPGAHEGPRRLLFVGHLKSYKGVPDLLTAFTSLGDRVPVQLTVAGRCTEPDLRVRLDELGTRPNVSAVIGDGLLPSDRLTDLLSEADIVVLPFRRITTSGSAILALSHGRPVLIPDLPGLADIPDAAAIRYDGTIAGLRAAIVKTAELTRSELAARSAAALAHAYRVSWREIARQTRDEIDAIQSSSSPGNSRSAA